MEINLVPISVVIPVGPNPAYLEWLPEAIESVRQQTHKASEIFLVLDGTFEFRVDDYIGIVNPTFDFRNGKRYFSKYNELFTVYRAPVRLGVAAIYNIGVALAENNCVFMLGSDDKLMPTCLEECALAYEKNNQKDAWYNVTTVTQSGDEQWIPNHCSMITKKLFSWFERGNGYFGFPPSAGVGGPDALLLSILMRHAPAKIVQVKQGTPLVWLREHEHQATKQDASFFPEEMVSIRNKETMRFKNWE